MRFEITHDRHDDSRHQRVLFGRSKELSLGAGALLIIAISAGAYFMKPAELRRDAMLEVKGWLNFADSYEIVQEGCPGQKEGLIYSPKTFFAENDIDALAFGRGIKTDCGQMVVYRLTDPKLGFEGKERRRRISEQG